MTAAVSAGTRRRRPSAETEARARAFAAALRSCPHDGHWVPSDDDPTRMVRCLCFRRALEARRAPVDQPLPLAKGRR